MCAHLAPGLVSLDRWGYPLLPKEPLTSTEERTAGRAVKGCPHRALFLAAADEVGRTHLPAPRQAGD